MSVFTDGRAFAEEQMTLTLTPYIPGVKTTVNEQEVQGYAAQSPVKGKVAGQSRLARDSFTRTVTVGAVEVPVIEAGLHLPISAPVPAGGERGIGWEYVVTRVGPDDDPALLGRRYLVTSSPAQSFATARRLDVAEVPQ